MSLESHRNAEGLKGSQKNLGGLEHRITEGKAKVGLKKESEIDLSELESVDETHVRNMYQDVLKTLEKTGGFSTKAPDIRFEGFREMNELKDKEGFERLKQGLLDNNNYELILSDMNLDTANIDYEREKARMAIKSVINSRLSNLTDQSLEKLSDIYGMDANVSDTRATHKENGSNGSYLDRRHPSAHQQSIRFSYSVLNFLDMETGEIRDKAKIPPGKNKEDMKYVSIAPGDVSDHEVMHALHFQNNPHVLGLSKLVSSDVAGDEAEYKTDLRRASIEAITVFEEELNHEIEDSGLDIDFNNPYLTADILSHECSPGEEFLYDSPYDLGKAVAFTVDSALREEHGEEKGRELARDYLMNIITSPTGLEGAIERSLEMRGLPDFHSYLREYHDRIVDVQDGEQELIEIGEEIANEFDPETADENQTLEAYYKVKAAESTFYELEGFFPPEEYDSSIREVKRNIW